MVCFRLLFHGSLIFLLSGCASTLPVQQPVTRPAHPEQATFVVVGRIAVNHQGERTSAAVRWTHAAEADEILLFAPLGKVVAHLQRNAQGFVLDTPDKRYTAQNAEELTQLALGWRLPLAGLQYWVLALPVPGEVFDAERDTQGQINFLRQDGWAIRYTGYASSAPDSLPLRIILQRDELEIKLLIDEWETP